MATLAKWQKALIATNALVKDIRCLPERILMLAEVHAGFAVQDHSVLLQRLRDLDLDMPPAGFFGYPPGMGFDLDLEATILVRHIDSLPENTGLDAKTYKTRVVPSFKMIAMGSLWGSVPRPEFHCIAESPLPIHPSVKALASLVAMYGYHNFVVGIPELILIHAERKAGVATIHTSSVLMMRLRRQHVQVRPFLVPDDRLGHCCIDTDIIQRYYMDSLSTTDDYDRDAVMTVLKAMAAQ